MLRSGFVGSHGRSIFSFLRNYPTVFHIGYTNLKSHQPCKNIVFFLCFLANPSYLLSFNSHDSESMRCEADLIVILLYISQWGSEHLLGRNAIFNICVTPILHIVQAIQFSRSVVSNSLQPHGLQHARPPCPSPTPGVHSDSRPLSQWCHPAISSTVVSFSSHLQFCQHQGLFWGVSSLHEVAKVLEFQLQHQSFQWLFRTDCL